MLARRSVIGSVGGISIFELSRASSYIRARRTDQQRTQIITMLCSAQATSSGLLKLNLKSTACLTRIGQTRTMMKPKISLPYRGIYRTEGDEVKKDDILVCQGKMNYHPGLNVYFERDRSERLLKASCDGRVMISRELVDPDWSHPEMELNYGHRKEQPIHKLTFNVLPDKMPQSFKLVENV